MAEAFNKYSNEAAYEAVSHGTTSPEVSKVLGSSNPVRYDGRNTDTTGSPGVGDAVYLDPDDNVRFVGWKNFVPVAMPSGWYPVGVVINRFGRKVRLRYKYMKNSETTEPMIFIINSQSSSAITFKVPDTLSGTTTVDLGVTFMATTSLSTSPEAFVVELDTWLRSHQPGTGTLPGLELKWHAEYISNKAYIICDSANRKNDVNVTSTGLSLSIVSFYAAPENYYMYLPTDGGYNLAHGPICNKDAMLAFNGTRTPTSDVAPSSNGSPVTLDAFTNSPYCATLRSTFGTYEVYLQSRLFACPTKKHPYYDEWNGRSYDLSTEMASCTYPNIDGVDRPYFKAITWSVAPDEDTTRATAVNTAFRWHMPDVIETYWYVHGRGTTQDDPVWSTLGKIGGDSGTMSAIKRTYAINSWKSAETRWVISSLWSLTYDGGNHERHRGQSHMSFADYELTGGD